MEGVSVEAVALDGRQVPAFVFRHSRRKQVLGCVLAFGFVLICVAMYRNPEGGQLPIVGRNAAVARWLAVLGGAFMLGLVARGFWLLRRPASLLALTPQGIVSTSMRPPLFVPWDAIDDIERVGRGGSRAVGVLLSPDDHPSLRAFGKKMKANRAFSGWDCQFSSQVFEARPALVETALQFYVFQPAERASIGTADGLATLQQAVADKWRRPELGPRDRSELQALINETERDHLRPADTVEAYCEKFQRAPLGRWSSSFDYGPFPTDAWEFAADGTGKLFQYAGSGDNTLLFEWREAAERTIEFRTTDWGEQEDEEPPMEWKTIVYDFKIIDFYGPTIVMFQVPEGETCKFWLTMDYLRFEGGIEANPSSESSHP